MLFSLSRHSVTGSSVGTEVKLYICSTSASIDGSPIISSLKASAWAKASAWDAEAKYVNAPVTTSISVIPRIFACVFIFVQLLTSGIPSSVIPSAEMLMLLHVELL